ncbi:MAG: hypothetical protein MR775_04925 [Erysipelotrichaceae bacterium]|nr:hypothetical protein [Erysipelotrichaceae bacterium]
MDVVYYAIIYLKDMQDVFTEIHMKPFETKEEAQKCCSKVNNVYGERVLKTKIRRTDLAKTGEFWL